MTVQELRDLLDSGEFHHATYRNKGTVWEGLWIYRKYDGLRGFEPADMFAKNSPELDAAFSLLMSRGIGSCVGSYGNG